MKLKGFLTKKQAALLLSGALFNLFVYYGSRLVTVNRPHIDLSNSIDNAIPVIPWMILIYYGCYAFWVLNYCLCVKFEKSDCNRVITAHFIGETVCLVFFLLLPTTMTRPEITGTGFFDSLLRMTYTIDRADNLLPSLHCFVSWLCYIGVRGNKQIPLWYRVTSLVIALSVFVSTVTVKQHVVIDIAVGAALAEISYALAGSVARFVRDRIYAHDRHS